MKKSALCCMVIVLTVCFAGCFTPKKLDQQVEAVYKEKAAKKKKPLEQITISSPLQAGVATSVSRSKTSRVLPLIVYIGLTYSNICMLNPQIPLTNFSNVVHGPAGKALLKKLGDRKLELTVQQIPTEFSIVNRGHMVLLLVAWEKTFIEGTPTNLVVNYKVTGGDDKQGTISIPYPNDRMNLGYFKSWKKATTEYLDQYEATTNLMAKQCVEKLEKEL